MDRTPFLKKLIEKLLQMLKVADLKSQEHLTLISISLITLVFAFFIPLEYLTAEVRQVAEGTIGISLFVMLLLNARKMQEERKEKKEEPPNLPEPRNESEENF